MFILIAWNMKHENFDNSGKKKKRFLAFQQWKWNFKNIKMYRSDPCGTLIKAWSQGFG